MHLSRAAETLRWHLIPMMEAQKRLGHEVCVCCGEDSGDAQKLRNAGFEVFTHGMKRSVNPVRALRAIWRIRGVLRQRRIEAVVCHTSLGALVGRLGAWLADTPCVVYFVHGLACGPAQGPLDWQVRFQVEKRLAGLTDAIITMNDYDERLSRSIPLARSAAGVYRIPGMGVDLTRFSMDADPGIRDRVGRELAVAGDSTLVLCVARLIPEKGVGVFVEAARLVARERSHACFVLAGSGPLLDCLVRAVREDRLEGQIKILGWRDDIQDLMKAADLFVLPSYFMEGLPVSILEAMACGKPVIATHHKGCEDVVVDGETGFLVPVKQPAPLAERIVKLLDDPALRARMGCAGRRRVEEHYELGACTDEIVGILERVLQRADRAPRR